MNFDADYTVRRPADFDYNAAIAELEEQVLRKKHVTAQLAHFKGELTRLTRLEESRRTELDLENEDVARLQRISPAVILYTITGQKADMLAKEEAEALAAAARYETVQKELAYAESRVSQLSAELRRLGNCERKLEDMIEEKKQKLLEQDTDFSQRTTELEQVAKVLRGELLEIEQALETGQRVQGMIRSISNQLEQAYDLSVTDMSLFRYRNTWGYVRDTEKHEHLDHAQSILDKLGQYMQEFASELGDVDWDMGDLPDPVSIRGGTRTLDLYFDNIFTDFAVRRHIVGSLEDMSSLADKIQPVVEALISLKAAKEAELREAEEAVRKWVQGS